MMLLKKSIFVLLFSFCLLFSREVTDQLGRVVTIPDEVSRIVVLQHQSVNILVQLNATEKIVGLLENWEGRLGKEYKKLAPELVGLPTPGDLKVINYEAVLKLKPDVVIVAHYIPEEYIKKMEELKIPVVGFSFFRAYGDDQRGKVNPSLDAKRAEAAYDEGLYDAIEIIGDIANKQKEAKELIDYVKKAQIEVANVIPKVPKNQRTTIYMANPNFQTYGSGKYTNIIFSRAGGINVAAKDLKGAQQASIENILTWNPEVIFIQERYPQVVEEIKNNRGFDNIKAVKDGRVYLMPEYAKAWGHPTPEAMALGEFWVAKKLYPEALKDFDLESKVEEYYQKFYRTSYKSK